ncbi:MAG: heme-binding protein [Bacteroidota bacterium]
MKKNPTNSSSFSPQQGYQRLRGNTTEDLLQSGAAHKQGLSQLSTPQEITSRLWQDLEGTWVGSKGWNIIAVPAPGSQPEDEGRFKLMVHPFTETLSFTNAGAPARNRGGELDQFIAALEYQQRVSHRETDELLHIEDGMFMNLATIVNQKGQRQPSPEFPIARSGTIPHGDSIMLLGKTPTAKPGAPDISNISSLPPDIGKVTEEKRKEYLKQYSELGTPVNIPNPNASLREELEKQAKEGLEITETITMAFDSQNSGGIVNIPFIVKHANATRMQAIFWLEKVRNKHTDQEFDQLQYTQIIDLEFHRKFGSDPDKNDLIIWPHITINTLVKQ